MKSFNIPILLLMFNRPLHSEKVFASISKIRPSKLYVAVDGPRINNSQDSEQIKRCLSLLDKINWPCELVTLVRDKNLGCGKAVSQAITWFFEQVEMGIILEDDCLPEESFYYFCEKLLMKYQYEYSVMHIGGSNYQNSKRWGNSSYYFTKICHVWGWATWRRAWAKYDFRMKNFQQFIDEKIIEQIFHSKEDQNYWTEAFRKVNDGTLDTWDYQWVYCIWTNNSLCISPNTNLVENIGFDEFATHTKKKNLQISKNKIGKIDEIIHPLFILENKGATEYSLKKLFRTYKGWKNKVHRMKLRLKFKTWHI